MLDMRRRRESRSKASTFATAGDEVFSGDAGDSGGEGVEMTVFGEEA